MIDTEFVAAALAVDLRTPVFSDNRAALVEFLPDSFTIQPSGATDLHDRVLTALSDAPALSVHARLFRDRLASGEAQALLGRDIAAYLEEVETGFSATGADLEEAVRAQFEILLRERRKLLDNPDTCALAEGPLLPVSLQ